MVCICVLGTPVDCVKAAYRRDVRMCQTSFEPSEPCIGWGAHSQIGWNGSWLRARGDAALCQSTLTTSSE